MPDPGEIVYELYRERYRITEWRNGTVYAVESEGCHWVEDSVYDANVPAVTGILYASVTDHDGVTIRRKAT